MDIEKRFESLEKKLRLHRRLGLAAACLIAVAIVIGAAGPVPKVIEAEKFILKDASGKMRGEWEIYKNGPRFALYDKNAKLR